MNRERADRILEVSWRAAMPTQLAYAMLATWFGVEMLATHSVWLRADYILGVAVCLWLVHCRRAVLCVCRSEDMVVTLAGRTATEMLAKGVGRHVYVTVPYAVVAGISAGWRELFLVNAHGGITVVPVDWHELTARDRGYILRRLGEAREEKGGEGKI